MDNPKTPPETIIAFRERYDLKQEDLDRLFGFTSKGRACRRWEAEGAPYYVTVLMAYVDAYGIAKMKELSERLVKT